MPALAVLDTRQLSAELTTQPKSPKDLCEALGVSRATLNRKMAVLLEEGLILQEGSGPSTTYRKKTPDELLAEATQPAPQTKVFVEMLPQTAHLTHRALDMYSRLGMGQFEVLADLAREGLLKRRGGGAITPEQVDRAEDLLKMLKQELLDMPSNASFGIRGEHVHEDFKTAFSLNKALRHRLAWDRTPEGRTGVYHDEPMPWDHIEGLEVHSGPAQPHIVDLSQVPEGLMMQFKAGKYRVIGPSADGEAFQVYGESVSWQTAITKARNAAQGKPPVSLDF